MTITPEEVAKLNLKAMQGDIVPILYRVSDMADLIARMDEALKAADALEAVMAEYSKYANWFPQKAYDALAAYKIAREKLK